MNPADLTCRRLLILAEGLPQGALTWGHEHWGVREELAAEAVEMLDAVRRQTAASAGVKRSKLKNPLRIPRPAYLEKPSKSRRVKSAGEFAAFFRGIGGSK